MIKGQVLADLIVVFLKDQTKERVQSQEATGVFTTEISPPWTVYTDAATNQKDSGVGVVIISPNRIVLEKSLRLSCLATNNKAESEALLLGLEAVKCLVGNSIEVFSDSQLSGASIGRIRGQRCEDASLFGQDKATPGTLSGVHLEASTTM